MKIGITQLLLGRERKLDEWLPKVKEAGYDCIEILMTDEGDLPLDYTEADVIRLKDLSDSSGVSLVSMLAAVSQRGTLATNDASERERFIDVTRKSIDAAAALGIDTILTIPGGPSEAVRYDVAYQQNLEGMRAVVPYAEEKGVNLAIEYVWNGMFLSPLEMKRFLDEVGSPRVGFYMDPGNMAMFSIPEQWVEILGSHIHKVHFKDFKKVWGESRFEWNALLEGEVNYPRFMAALRSIGYQGEVISEVDAGLIEGASDSWEAHRRTAEAMRKILAM
ncbi:MAG: sugar phosphate isomerase/epimerase [Armatimonadetes bacterium]|nr:sugar phosphate isomerase/epimerase [Armatimonadota bacterium]